ncbi:MULTISPECIES: glycosyltransferase family 2 protein [Carnobacterium]|uniref:glycosyltransferase family 2 protein n=2 Tax=Carnobacteriaceae TaxID=186828 RepID=UPI00203C4E9A|nr:glycosyltransferase family 2 protein [Carnobacterium inhibens]MCM3511322.1 glycosyltransferase family 2 protein [Carnobacterium inhibens]
MLSIVVPVYNVDKVLRHCLNSLRFQSYRNIEIILVNGESTDMSAAICERFARIDSRFKVLNKKARGLCEALNIGLLSAKGEYISFVDPVDRIDGLMFEKLLLTIIRNNADMVIANHGEELIEKDIDLFNTAQAVVWTKETALRKITEQFQLKSFLCNKLYSIELFRSNPVLEFDLNFDLFGDYLMAVQCILKSEKIMYDPNLHYHYLAYKHASFFNDLTKEKLSGPKALLKIIDLTEEMSRFNVSVIKDLYINYSIQLLMHLLNEQEKNTRHLKEAKQNLYHFSLNELTNYKIIFSCMMARKMTFIYFYFWKLKHAKLN